MAITGKHWTAVLHHEWLGSVTSETAPVLVLDYDIAKTTPAEIASYYPTLSWDHAVGLAPQELRQKWLLQCYPTPADAGIYSSDEEAILDEQNFYESLVPNGERGTQQHYDPIRLRWKGGWVVAQQPGTPWFSPSQVWAFYPDANTYGITTAAPFGSGLGNGTIKNQALYTFLNNDYGNDPVAAQPVDPPLVSDTGTIYVGVIDKLHIFTPIDDGTGGSAVDGVGDGQLPTDDITVRCWGFSLDGHDFYVLRLGSSATFVYDLTTGTWSEWESPGRTNWRAHVGQNWVGANDYSFYDTDIIAGDDASGTLWRLVTSPQRDERSDMTARDSDKITHVVVGGIQVTGRDVIPCNAVTLDIDLGSPSQTDASILLEISDDLGETWTDCGSQIIIAADFTATVEWRGLGLIRAPGRLFRFTDDGATVSFKGANLR